MVDEVASGTSVLPVYVYGGRLDACNTGYFMARLVDDSTGTGGTLPLYAINSECCDDADLVTSPDDFYDANLWPPFGVSFVLRAELCSYSNCDAASGPEGDGLDVLLVRTAPGIYEGSVRMASLTAACTGTGTGAAMTGTGTAIEEIGNILEIKVDLNLGGRLTLSGCVEGDPRQSEECLGSPLTADPIGSCRFPLKLFYAPLPPELDFRALEHCCRHCEGRISINVKGYCLPYKLGRLIDDAIDEDTGLSQEDLILWWNLNEGEGGTAFDTGQDVGTGPIYAYGDKCTPRTCQKAYECCNTGPQCCHTYYLTVQCGECAVVTGSGPPPPLGPGSTIIPMRIFVPPCLDVLSGTAPPFPDECCLEERELCLYCLCPQWCSGPTCQPDGGSTVENACDDDPFGGSTETPYEIVVDACGLHLTLKYSSGTITLDAEEVECFVADDGTQSCIMRASFGPPVCPSGTFIFGP